MYSILYKRIKYNKCDKYAMCHKYNKSSRLMSLSLESPNAETSENQCKSRLSSLCSANKGSEKTTWIGIISNDK